MKRNSNYRNEATNVGTCAIHVKVTHTMMLCVNESSKKASFEKDSLVAKLNSHDAIFLL